MAGSRQGSLEITVKGQAHQVEATPETPLLYVLRNELKLNAAKFGCGLSQCGACTVHVDGQAVRSCQYPVGDAEGAEVTTLEGLGGPDDMHPLQQAFLDEQAAQCGYCIPGMIMTAAALLNQNEQPDESDFGRRLAGTSAGAGRTCGSCRRSSGPLARRPSQRGRTPP